MNMHNYGLENHVVQTTPFSGESIRVEKPYKKVILTNVAECENRITVDHVRHRLMGMRWFEWEDLLSHWLVEAIVEAIRTGKTEADITKMFTCELLGEDKIGDFSKPQEEVIDFIMGRLFECLEEDDEMMRVRIIEKSIIDC